MQLYYFCDHNTVIIYNYHDHAVLLLTTVFMSVVGAVGIGLGKLNFAITLICLCIFLYRSTYDC